MKFVDNMLISNVASECKDSLVKWLISTYVNYNYTLLQYKNNLFYENITII